MVSAKVARTLGSIRCQSSSSRLAPAPEIAAWIERITSRSAEVTYDDIDDRRASQLRRTLPTRLGPKGGLDLPDKGTLPKAHHLAYFQPGSLLTELGEDGSSTEYNAPAPYLRRMWAGGSFEWPSDPQTALRIGERATQANSVASAEFKSGMIFVNQKRELYHDDPREWAVREIRTHVFRREVSGNEAVKARAKKEATSATPPAAPSHTFTYTPTAPLLFRYSALTYNAHRIHYDRDWCKSVENHQDLVVHGPLTATLLVELAERVALDTGTHLRRFEYRATSPMYVDRDILMEATPMEGQEGKVEMTAKQEGRVGMRAVATFEAV